jgi:biotin operon repressor
MATHVSRSQLRRLMQLILALQSSRYPSARQLAEHCEVSQRTIYRDLETLVLLGVPVRYQREKQGYQLVPGFVFQFAQSRAGRVRGTHHVNGSRQGRRGSWAEQERVQRDLEDHQGAVGEDSGPNARFGSMD